MSALGLGLVAALCWGLHDITIRYLSRNVALLAALFMVLIFGAVFQVGAILVLGGTFTVSSNALLISICAGISFLIASLGLYFAFERGPVRLVAPIIASYPILTLVFALFSGTTFTVFQALAVFAIVVGIGIVAALSDTSEDGIPPIGPTILLATISAIGFATTFKLGHVAAEISGELPTTFVTRLTSLILLFAIMIARRSPLNPGRKAVVPLVLMGLLDGIALLSVISAANMPNADYASVVSSMFGLLTIVLAWMFLRERMSLPQWAGCLLAFAGVGYLAT